MVYRPLLQSHETHIADPHTCLHTKTSLLRAFCGTCLLREKRVGAHRGAPCRDTPGRCRCRGSAVVPSAPTSHVSRTSRSEIAAHLLPHGEFVVPLLRALQPQLSHVALIEGGATG